MKSKNIILFFLLIFLVYSCKDKDNIHNFIFDIEMDEIISKYNNYYIGLPRNTTQFFLFSFPDNDIVFVEKTGRNKFLLQNLNNDTYNRQAEYELTKKINKDLKELRKYRIIGISFEPSYITIISNILDTSKSKENNFSYVHGFIYVIEDNKTSKYWIDFYDCKKISSEWYLFTEKIELYKE